MPEIKSGKENQNQETTIVELDNGRKIETHFSFYGGGVLSSLAWNGFRAVNEEELRGVQIHEGGCFRNSQAPKVGDVWAALHCGQAGHVYLPHSLVRQGEETKVERLKIVWVGKYPNNFGYDKNIVIMEMLNN